MELWDGWSGCLGLKEIHSASTGPGPRTVAHLLRFCGEDLGTDFVSTPSEPRPTAADRLTKALAMDKKLMTR